MGLLLKNIIEVSIYNSKDGRISISINDDIDLDPLSHLHLLYLSLSKCLFDLGNQPDSVDLILNEIHKDITDAISQQYEVTLLDRVFDQLNQYYDFDVRDHLKIHNFHISNKEDQQSYLGKSNYIIKCSRFNIHRWVISSYHSIGKNKILIPINICALFQQIFTENIMGDKFGLKITDGIHNKLLELNSDSTFFDKLRNLPSTTRFINDYIYGLRKGIREHKKIFNN